MSFLARSKFALKILAVALSYALLAAAQSSARELDPDWVRDWADEYFKEAIEDARAVGAAVLVVDTKGTLLSQGYGYGDLESREPIHPAVSYIPIGDIGNIFVIKSLMALRDNKQISFDAPINDFLTRVQLSSELSNLTIVDVLQHQSGLSISAAGTMQASSRTTWDARAFSKELRITQPVGASGQRHYSSYGAGLAALVAEDVSGTSTYEVARTALEENLGLKPFINVGGQEPPQYVVQHYTISRNGEKSRQRFHTSSPVFAASKGINMTMGDIAKLSRSVLTEVKSENAEASEEPQPTSLTTLAFERRSYPGHTMTPHPLAISGTVQSATTDLLLLPDLSAAIFVMVTGRPKSPDFSLSSFLPMAGGDQHVLEPIKAQDATKDFVLKFARVTDLPRKPVAQRNLRKYRGVYGGASWPLQNTKELFSLQRQIAKVELAPDQGLMINRQGPFLSLEGQWFENPNSGALVEFEVSDKGKITSLRRDGNTSVRLENPKSLIAGFGAALVCLLLSLLLFAAPSWVGRSVWENIAKWVGATTALLVCVIFGLPLWHYVIGWPSPFIDHSMFALWRGLVLAGAFFAVATIGLTLIAWAGRYWAMDGHGFARRRRYTMGAAGLGGLLYLALQIGLLPTY